MATKMNVRLSLLLAVGALVLLALLPQMLFVLGGKWNGTYFVSNYDEPAYSAYVNALINGAPRKNDPFMATSEIDQTAQPETLYSIQFIPAYAIALPARILGLDVSTAFILLAMLIAGFSVLALYALFFEITGDKIFSTVCPVIVLCLGTAAAFQGELRNMISGALLVDFLPFLRRYQPGISFPLFFVFCLFVNRAVKTNKGTATIWAAASGAVFAILVYSYFFLWTAAAAWLFCFAAVSFAADRDRIRRLLSTVGVIGAFAAASLIPYFWLLSHRSANIDSVQLLDHTRMPVFLSPSLILGVIVAGVAVWIYRKYEGENKLHFVMLVSMGLTPVVLFNQQIVTGRSLQPVHYEIFIANYLVLAAAVLLVPMIPANNADARNKIFIYVAAAAFLWGGFEAYSSANRAMIVAEIRDGSVPSVRAAAGSSRRPVILATNFVTADFIPSIAVARSFWNPHTSSAGGIGVEENQKLFYRFLYFSGYTPRELEEALDANSFEVTAAIFGSERALPALAGAAKKITPSEIKAEVARFTEHSSALTAASAYDPAIDAIIVPADSEPSFANLDRWYTRDQGEQFGLFKMYRLTRKP